MRSPRRLLGNAGARCALLVALLVCAHAAADAAPPANPHAADRGGATQHGDTAASDTSPLAGPGLGPVRVVPLPLFAACPSVLFGRDDLLVAVCTQILNQTPAVFLLHPDDGRVLASLPLNAGASLFGGVYPYLDREDRLVVVDGQQTLLRIAHRRGSSGAWQLEVDARIALTRAPDLAADDTVVGLVPDHDGRVWFATASGRVGLIDAEGAPRVLALPAGERIANSIASAPAGTAVVTDHALYLLRAVDDSPQIAWRAAYARGPARKPGKLSRGSGSTPTFFGPRTGGEYLTIVDDAAPLEHVLVFDAHEGSLHCTVALPEPTGRGGENSPIGAGDRIYVASTHGYPYPALPAGAGPSVPASAPLGGGLTRVDVRPDGCAPAWTSPVRSAAVPKLSLADALIYTVERTPLAADGMAGPLDAYQLVAIDPESGAVRVRHALGAGALSDTMQLAGTLAPGRVLYQGTIGGILRIAPE